MNDFKVGDRVEYVGAHREMRRLRFLTIERVSGSRADVKESTGWSPFLTNLLHVTPDVITIDRADLPEVRQEGDAVIIVRGKGVIYTANHNTETARASAADFLALAEFLEAREKAAEEAATEKEASETLNKRRDELARKLYQSAHGFRDNYVNYDNRERMVRTAIDRIIELEDARG